MSKRTQRTCPVMRCLRSAGLRAAAFGRAVWRFLRRHRVPVEVVLADESRRRALKHDISTNLRRLQKVFGTALPADAVVIVQQVIPTHRQPAGCFQVGAREDGGRYAVIRLALQVNGRRLSTDEVLATLAEQCIGIVSQDARSVVVPVDFDPGAPPPPQDLPRDPLAPAA